MSWIAHFHPNNVDAILAKSTRGMWRRKHGILANCLKRVAINAISFSWSCVDNVEEQKWSECWMLTVVGCPDESEHYHLK